MHLQYVTKSIYNLYIYIHRAKLAGLFALKSVKPTWSLLFFPLSIAEATPLSPSLWILAELPSLPLAPLLPLLLWPLNFRNIFNFEVSWTPLHSPSCSEARFSLPLALGERSGVCLLLMRGLGLECVLWAV